MKRGSPQPRPLTELEFRGLRSIHSKLIGSLCDQNSFLVGQIDLGANCFGGQIGLGANCFQGLFVSGVILFPGAFVPGGILSGGLWPGDFCPGAFCRGLLTGYPGKAVESEKSGHELLKVYRKYVCSVAD